MNKVGRIRILSIVFFIFISFVTTYELYSCGICIAMEDRFDVIPDINSDICVRLGKPMSIVTVMFISLMIATLILFLIGVWKGRWCYLIWWVSLQLSNVTILIAYTILAPDKILPVLLCVSHFLLWFVGIYIHCSVMRFKKQTSFA